MRRRAVRIDLTGQSIASVRAAIALEIATDAGWLITIEGDYTLHRTGGEVLDTTRGEEDLIVTWLARQVGAAILGFHYGEREDLTVSLAGGTLRVPFMDRFEAWSILGPRKERVISMPGGELAIWSAERRPRT